MNRGNVTDEMRQEWKRKIAVIRKAQKVGQSFLYITEVDVLDIWEKAINKGYDLSFRQSSWLTKIYNRIG